jgi:hypothetical protein
MKAMPLLALLAVALPAAAIDDAAVQRCRVMTDAAQRLACYDGLPLAAPSTPRAPVAAPPAAAAAAPAPAAAPAAASPSLLSRFGFENRAQPDELPIVESYIPGRFEGWGPKSAIALANGQVWQVIDDSARTAYRENPKVTLRRGSMGSFFLDIEGVNPSPRVRRIQ